MYRAALCLKEGNTRKYGGKKTVNEKKILVNWITIGSWIISILLDPLICYGPSIDDEKKLLKINSSLLISIWALYWSLLIYRISISFCVYKGHLQIFNMAEAITLLFSNVLYSLIFIPKMDISAPAFSVVLGILLAVYLARIIGIYKLFKKEVPRSASVKLGEAPIMKIGFGFTSLLFLYGSHLFGGLWYLFAVRKKIECWKKACSNHGGCQYANNRFNVSYGDNKFLDDICFTKIDGTNPYEVGIFKDAIESRIVETTTELRKKLLYCFRWGIQNISGFGQNLQVSTYAWENIFVILIAIYGLGTFTYFIGNMQNFIKSAIDKNRKIVDQAIKQQLPQWFAFKKLPEDLQNCIKDYHQYNSTYTGGVDVKNLLSNLPEDVGNNLKYKLCLEQLKKVERFRMLSDASLRGICDYIEPIVYDEHTCIVRGRDPINKMLFVLDGQLVTHSTKILKGGDLWGEELVDWVLDNDNSSSSSSSKKLISLTKVEAFIFKIDGLKKLFHEKAKVIQSFFRKRRNNARCCEFGNLSLCRYRCAP